MAVSENGWPLISASQTQVLTGLPSNARVLAGPVATVLGYVANQFNVRVEGVLSTSSFRSGAHIGNGSLYSNHASGTAIDLNGGKHPQGAAGTFTAAQESQIRQIMAEVGGDVIRWGKDFKDEMHFEIRPKISAQQVAEAAGRLTTPEEDLNTEEHIALMQIRDVLGAQGGLNTPSNSTVLAHSRAAMELLRGMPNSVWMAPVNGSFSGHSEVHPAAEWLTVLAFRVAELYVRAQSGQPVSAQEVTAVFQELLPETPRGSATD